MKDMAGKRKFYITVAIDYANSSPHLGHAYEKVCADAIARFKRFQGYDTFYLMGNDEHSINVLRKARQLGKEPKGYCDEMFQVFKNTWDSLGIRYDEFMQTSGERHHRAVQTLIRKINDAGYIYQGTYKGWYCVSCEAFYPEKDLVDGKCPVHKNLAAEYIEEENYFFALSAFRDFLLKHIRKNPEFVEPETRRNEILNILEEGLEDISISRSELTWGIPVPFGNRDQVIYVWFDALTSYISGIGYGTDEDRFNRYWPADMHLIGKDITRFHCIVWPAMLKAAGVPLPKKIFGHGFLTLEGEKMSKTAGNVLDPVEFSRRFGLDALRYFLIAATHFGRDGNFTLGTFVEKVNTDLANDLGNLLSRTTAMIERYRQGKIPAPTADEDDGILRRTAEEVVRKTGEYMDDFRLHDALASIWDLVHAANKYIEDTSPWDLFKDPSRERQLDTVLYNLAESLRILGLLLTPFLVKIPAEIWRQLGIKQDLETFRWEDVRWGGLPAGIKIARGEPIFPRIDLQQALAGADGQSGRAPAAPDVSPTDPVEEDSEEVSVDDFQRIDLRVAEILEAEAVQGSDRLLKLVLDTGGRQRQVVAGIAGHYRPEELVGARVVLVANLKPATIRGVRSEGMVLAAVDGDRPVLVTVEDHRVPPGTKVR